jgi:hypothetical protein
VLKRLPIALLFWVTGCGPSYTPPDDAPHAVVLQFPNIDLGLEPPEGWWMERLEHAVAFKRGRMFGTISIQEAPWSDGELNSSWFSARTDVEDIAWLTQGARQLDEAIGLWYVVQFSVLGEKRMQAGIIVPHKTHALLLSAGSPWSDATETLGSFENLIDSITTKM